MKLIYIFIALLFLVPSNAFSKDYMVELFEEHYKEIMIVGGGEMKIYHTWQVTTRYGNKLLVLVGDDSGYRSWLRQMTGKHNIFIVKIPDDGDDKFVHDRAVLVNVQQVHGIWDQKWKCEKCRHGSPPIADVVLDESDVNLP